MLSRFLPGFPARIPAGLFHPEIIFGNLPRVSPGISSGIPPGLPSEIFFLDFSLDSTLQKDRGPGQGIVPRSSQHGLTKKKCFGLNKSGSVEEKLNKFWHFCSEP